MTDEKNEMVGMSKEDMWKQNESKNGDAIIAIDEHGNATLAVLLTNECWKIQAIDDFDDLGEYEFKDTVPGLWYANMTAGGCGLGGHNYGCEGDCFFVEWDIVKPLYTIMMGSEKL